MLTAKDIVEVISVLDRITSYDMEQFRNPELVGKLSANAFCAALTLKLALRHLQIEVCE